MPAPASPPPTPRATTGLTPAAPQHLLAAAQAALRTPGLVILTGPPGAGRTTLLHKIGNSFAGPTHHGGALAMLRSVPALPLTRALRVRLPTTDHALLTEAVRSRIRSGLLCLDDLQWADPDTLAVLPALAAHCRIAATLRLPHQLPPQATAALHAAATATLAIPPLTPTLTTPELATVVRRAGGSPLAVTILARAAKTTSAEHPHAIAEAIADLTRPARTALAALGLLGRPANPAILGPGLADLAAAHLVHLTADTATPTSPYLAEIAAGLLDPTTRQAIHSRLATLVTPVEAPRHLAAAGRHQHAYTAAVTAAAHPTTTPTERADLLHLACHLPDVTQDPAIELAAAQAALTAGRPATCLRLLENHTTHAAAATRGEAHLQRGDPAAALTAVRDIPDEHPDPTMITVRDRIRLLASPTTATLDDVLTRHGPTPPHTGLRAAIAAAKAANRTPGWETALATAAATAGTTGDTLAARWSAWTLAETLTADARLTQAAATASQAATACRDELAYSWHTRFAALGLWADALHGATPDEIVRRAATLADHTLPAAARGYATAALALTEADTGLLGTARARLADRPSAPSAPAAALAWVDQEAAWLDGAPTSSHPTKPHPTLVDGLRRLTARWAAHDTQTAADPSHHPDDLPLIRDTLTAWNNPSRFPQAARNWENTIRREHVRCLLAAGLLDPDPTTAVTTLLTAEHLAEQAGLTVLLGKIQRALRRHAVRRVPQPTPTDTTLTNREHQVMRLVAQGAPSRRIAGQLGISPETVETHIRSGMRKLGARTRTEAAALVIDTRATP